MKFKKIRKSSLYSAVSLCGFSAVVLGIAHAEINNSQTSFQESSPPQKSRPSKKTESVYSNSPTHSNEATYKDANLYNTYQGNYKNTPSYSKTSYKVNTSASEDGSNLPNLPNANEPSFNSSFLTPSVNDATSIAQGLNDLDDDQSSQEYLKQQANDMAKNALYDNVNATVNGWLNGKGRGEFNFSLDDDWKLDTFDLDYLLPIFGRDNDQFFSQFGAHTWDDRELLDLGFGYRRIYDNSYLLGINGFVDQDLTYNHTRGSVGLEAGARYFDFAANYYFPLSDWKIQTLKNGTTLEARAAKGFDTKITGYLPEQTQFSGSIEYFNWKNDGAYVDMQGGLPDSNDSVLDYLDRNGADPKGVNLGLAWKPIPLISTEFVHTVASDIKDNRLTMGLEYQFDQTLDEQLQPKNVASERMLSNMKTALVDRDYKMYLAYRAPASSRTASKPEILLDLPSEIYQEKAVYLQPEINDTTNIIGYQWVGTGVAYLDNPKAKNTTFRTPAFDNNNPNNEYTLQLRVTDSLGDITTSEETKIKVVPSMYAIHFYKDKSYSEEVDIANNGYYDLPTSDLVNPEDRSIYWTIIFTNDSRKLTLGKCTQGSAKATTTDAQCSYNWSDPTGLLENSNVITPVIKRLEKPMNQHVKLKITPKNHNPVVFNIPINYTKPDFYWDNDNINQTGEYHLSRYSNLAGDDANFNIQTTASIGTTNNPDVKIKYSSKPVDGQPKPFTLLNEDTGEYTVTGVGEAIITAKGNGHFNEPISYHLYVTDDERSVVWKSDNDQLSLAANNGTVTTPFSIGKTIQIKALIANEDGSDYVPVKYYTQTGSDIVSVDQEGVVTGIKTGQARICAESTTNNTLSGCYDLNVEKGSLSSSWANPDIGDDQNEYTVTKGSTVDLSVQLIDNISGENISNDKDMDVSYLSSAQNIATSNIHNPSLFLISGTGKADITVTIEDPLGRYPSYKKTITLIATN